MESRRGQKCQKYQRNIEQEGVGGTGGIKRRTEKRSRRNIEQEGVWGGMRRNR